MNKILIADDEKDIRNLIKDILKNFDLEIIEAVDGDETIAQASFHKPHLIFLDLKMPKSENLRVLKLIKDKLPQTIVIVITAHGTLDIAVSAMKLGAYDFVAKPFDPEKIRIITKNALEKHELTQEVSQLKSELKRRFKFENIIGTSGSMQKVFHLINKVLDNDVTVFIQGESGTGKELVARAIHYNSLRKNNPFVVFNCAAIPETLMESELFGHEKGSFTGALEKRIGKFEQADKGTIFLDEIAEIAPAVQVKLLRVLQERSFERVGGRETINVDVRIISATNKNIHEELKTGRFREELYYRLSVFPILIPPLRERKEDIPQLVEHFLSIYSKEYNKPINEFSEKALNTLLNYSYPGNVRELENIVARAVVMSSSNYINFLPIFNFQHKESSSSDEEVLSLDGLEKEALINALQKSEGNISEAAETLGISRTTLYSKVKKYGINI